MENVTIAVRIPKQYREQLKEVAQREGAVGFSEIVRQAIGMKIKKSELEAISEKQG